MTENAGSDTAPPKNAASTDEALREIQSLIETQRDETRAARTGRSDLRWMIYVCVGLSAPMIAVQFFLAERDADFAATYIQIIGLVLSGWGVFRAFVWKASSLQNYARTIAWVYVICFFAFSTFYGTLLTYGISLKYTRGLPQFFFSSPQPMQKK